MNFFSSSVSPLSHTAGVHPQNIDFETALLFFAPQTFSEGLTSNFSLIYLHSHHLTWPGSA